jgi:hypothetical protein
MEEKPTPATRGAPEPTRRRLSAPRRWVAGRRRAGENGSALAFGIRLLASVGLAFAVVGVVSYVLIGRILSDRRVPRN